MNKIDIIRKISSRKFWALLSALAVTVTSIVFSEAVAVHVASIISAVGACAVYILGESHVDAARLGTEAAKEVHAAVQYLETDCDGSDFPKMGF